jgi:hypothetical protein
MLVRTVTTQDAEADMPGAPFTVADTLELPSVACATPATATRTFD